MPIVAFQGLVCCRQLGVLLRDSGHPVCFGQRRCSDIDDEKACGAKVAVDYPNAKKLFNEWKYGWRRVTVYGDYKDKLADFSKLMGFTVVEEG